MAGAEGETVLRAKYLDWCSARLAEEFLRLSLDEVYELARGAGDGPAPEASDPPLSYRDLVARVTDALRARLPIPSFVEWSDQYRANPEKYEAELIGFWTSIAEATK